MIEKEIEWLLKEKYKGKKTKKAEKDIKKLKKGEPVDYLIGFSDFLKCKVDLSFRPLIPRDETEFWAERVIEDIKKNKKRKIHCLDIFSGSGCVGISILKNTKKTFVDFSELDKNFLKQIKLNLKINRIDLKRYKIINSDIFEKIKIKYDYILANPPYIPQKFEKELSKSVMLYEPHGSLFGGKDGMYYIKRFLKKFSFFLLPNGKAYLEFDSRNKKKLEKLLKIYNISKYKFFRDQYKKWRYVILWK